MQIAALDGIEIEFEARGSGEPMVLIHGSAVADSHLPLTSEPSLAGFRLIRYRRRGYGASTHSPPPSSIAQQAGDCAALMRHLGVERAHIAGHSYGGVIAMELARDFPAMVHSLTLLEPALVFNVPAGATMVRGEMREKYYGGDKAGAVADFMHMVDGPNWRNGLDAVAGATEQAISDSDTFFRIEGGALMEWKFGPEDAERIKQPVLAIVGADTEPVFRETHELTLKWFPRARALTIPGATHMLMVLKPRAVAEPMAAFLREHPMS